MGPDLGVRVWSALGTRAELLITDPERLPAAGAAVDDLLREIDDACSRFRANSELSRVNQRAGRDLRVSPLLGGALAAALRGAVVTGGAVDPTVGTAMRQIGYDRDFADVLAEEGPIELRARPVPGWQVIEFDPLSLHLRVPRGVELDLGSTAKALAADLAAEAVRRVTGCGVLVSLGGDLATAGAAPRGGWQVRVTADSHDGPEGSGPVIAIAGGALATSSTSVRRWRRDTQLLHHIVDPTTGLPAWGRWSMATVAAATCVDANLAATCAIVRSERAERWLAQRHLDARLVSYRGETHTIGRWPSGTGRGVAA